MSSVTIQVNGVAQTREVEPRMLLVHFLRDELGLTGTHVGCDTSQCGACTVLIDGKAVKSCSLFAVQGVTVEKTQLKIGEEEHTGKARLKLAEKDGKWIVQSLEVE